MGEMLRAPFFEGSGGDVYPIDPRPPQPCDVAVSVTGLLRFHPKIFGIECIEM